MAIKKKKFIDVNLEPLNIKVPILVVDPDNIKGRVVRYDLTKILRGKNCEAKFRIYTTGDKNAAKIFFFKIQPSFIRKTIGKNISIIEGSFVFNCKDASLRIKPFLITRRSVHKKVRKVLRENVKSFIEEAIKDKPAEKIFQDILNSSLQRNLSRKLKKTYPLAVCEIRSIKIEN